MASTTPTPLSQQIIQQLRSRAAIGLFAVVLLSVGGFLFERSLPGTAASQLDETSIGVAGQNTATSTRTRVVQNWTYLLTFEQTLKLSALLEQRTGNVQLSLYLLPEPPMGIAPEKWAELALLNQNNGDLAATPAQGVILAVNQPQQIVIRLTPKLERAFPVSTRQQFEIKMRENWRRQGLYPALQSGIKELATALNTAANAQVTVSEPAPGTSTNLMRFLLWLPLIVLLLLVLHESAHLLAARALGVKLRRLVVGFGPSIGLFELDGAKIQVNCLPFGDRLSLVPQVPAIARWRLWLVSAAGPLVHALLWLGLHLAQTRAWPWYQQLTETSPVLASFLWHLNLLNVTSCFLNLIPFQFGSTANDFITDGYQLVRVPLYTGAELADTGPLEYCAEAQELRQANQGADAIAVCERGLQAFPQHPALLNLLANCRLQLGEYAQAHQDFLAVLANETVQTKPDLKAILLCNYAYTCLLLNAPELLVEADANSFEAYRLAPDNAFIQSTRGAVLLHINRPYEALNLLQSAIKQHAETKALTKNNPLTEYHALSEKEVLTTTACWLAHGEAMFGHFDLAKQWLHYAKQNQPRTALLQQTEHEVQNLILQYFKQAPRKAAGTDEFTAPTNDVAPELQTSANTPAPASTKAANLAEPLVPDTAATNILEPPTHAALDTEISDPEKPEKPIDLNADQLIFATSATEPLPPPDLVFGEPLTQPATPPTQPIN